MMKSLACNTVTVMVSVEVAPELSVAENWNVRVVPADVAGAVNVRVFPDPDSVTVGDPAVCVQDVEETVPSESDAVPVRVTT